jgi:DNA-binding XRE family transcriptional regulator
MNNKTTPCRQVRLALGLSQKEFSAQVQVAKQTIVDIEGRRGTYAKRIPVGLARRIAAISGAHPNSLVSQDGRAKSSELVDGRYEPYSERHAALWKAMAQDRMHSDDGPHPLIGEAVWTVASALVAADELGPLRASVLWEELQDVLNKRRLPASSKLGLSLGAGMSRHSAKRRSLGRGISTDGLDQFHPLTIIQLAQQEHGQKLLTLSGIVQTAAELAESEKTQEEASALRSLSKLLRQRGLLMLKESSPPQPSPKQALVAGGTAPRKTLKRKTCAPKRRR